MKSHKFIILIAFGFFLCGANPFAFAAPVIQTGDGILSNNSTFILSGVNFGARTEPGPLIWDSMESGSFNPQWKSTSDLNLTGARQRIFRSKYSASLNFSSQNMGGYFQSDVLAAPRWYVQYWFMLGKNWVWGTSDEFGSQRFLSNVTLFRLWNPSAPEEFFQISALGWKDQLEVRTDDPAPIFVEASMKEKINKEEWHLVQIEFQENSDPGVSDGHFRMWLDGKMLTSRMDVLSRTRRNVFRWPYVIGLSSEWGPNLEKGENVRGWRSFYLDDVYVANSWARVEIGDNPDYLLCRTREIQVPLSWEENKVKIQVNLGGFKPEAPVFLFVVNDRGEISNPGFPVWVDGSGISSFPSEIEREPIPSHFSISSNGKVKFGPEIFFIEVYDLSGKSLLTLKRETKNKILKWDGHSSEKKLLSPGEYKLKVQDLWGKAKIVPFIIQP